MNRIGYIALFILIVLGNTVNAGVEECNVWWSATQFLTDCAKNTPSIDPSLTPPTMGWMKEMIILIANGAISFGALLAVWAIVWSGIQYTKAFGSEEKLKKAKMTGLYSLIGLILLLISFGIVDIFINFIYTISGNS
jgi:hypothetical protein